MQPWTQGFPQQPSRLPATTTQPPMPTFQPTQPPQMSQIPNPVSTAPQIPAQVSQPPMAMPRPTVQSQTAQPLPTTPSSAPQYFADNETNSRTFPERLQARTKNFASKVKNMSKETKWKLAISIVLLLFGIFCIVGASGQIAEPLSESRNILIPVALVAWICGSIVGYDVYDKLKV